MDCVVVHSLSCVWLFVTPWTAVSTKSTLGAQTVISKFFFSPIRWNLGFLENWLILDVEQEIYKINLNILVGSKSKNTAQIIFKRLMVQPEKIPTTPKLDN